MPKLLVSLTKYGMETFREFLQQQPSAVPKWKASKDQIYSYWKTIQPNTPLAVNPVPYEHKGSTYTQDGVRVTGSPQFIGSVIARLKDFLTFESPTTKLQLVYRQTQSPVDDPNRNSFVFYVQVKERGAKQA